MMTSLLLTNKSTETINPISGSRGNDLGLPSLIGGGCAKFIIPVAKKHDTST